MDARLSCLDRIRLVVDRRSRTSQIVDLIDFDIERNADIVADQFKKRMVKERNDIFLRSCEKVIYAEDITPFGKKPFAEMGTEKQLLQSLKFFF